VGRLRVRLVEVEEAWWMSKAVAAELCTTATTSPCCHRSWRKEENGEGEGENGERGKEQA
jgi:hypothetical protein